MKNKWIQYAFDIMLRCNCSVEMYLIVIDVATLIVMLYIEIAR